MRLRSALALGLPGFVVAGLLCRCPAVGAETRPSTPAVVDLHVDLPYRVNYRGGSLARGSGQVTAEHLLASGVRGLVLPLFVPRQVSAEGPRPGDLEASFDRVLSLIPRTPPFALPGCGSPPGSVQTWLSFEGAAPLLEDPDSVARWTARGVRVFGLVHTTDNAIAGSSAGTSNVGLTPEGRDLVHRIFDAGGIVDVSHASDAATDEIVKLGEHRGRPVVATHSNARALTPHPRNLTDDQIRAIARTGGVVGVNFHSRFLVARGRAKLSDVVLHVRHLVRVAGADHVAIGSDFEGDILPPRELSDVRGFPRLATALARSGMPSSDIARVFGGNALALLCPAGAPTPRGARKPGRAGR